MIRSFRDKGLRQFFENGDRSRLKVQKLDRLRRILLSLDTAVEPRKMDLPGMRFHGLKGDKGGRYSVWMSGNWRITFGWDGPDAIDVDIEDYHR